jgi:hypothetical protein
VSRREPSGFGCTRERLPCVVGAAVQGHESQCVSFAESQAHDQVPVSGVIP